MGTGLLVGIGLLVGALLFMAWLDVSTRPRRASGRRGTGLHSSSGGVGGLVKALRRVERDRVDNDNDNDGYGHGSGGSFGCGGGGGGSD